MKKHLIPPLLCLDQLGCLPLDKTGADLLFPIINDYEREFILLIIVNRTFKQHSEIFI